MPAPRGRGLERVSDVQERFLRAAAALLPLDRVVELHLFPAMRQGGVETGFAVIAARRQPTALDDPETSPSDAPGGPPQLQDAGRSAASSHPSLAVDPEPGDSRLVVFSARYRLTLKGPDRGRWEVDVVEEADAPLVTVDAVVRGVQRRVGEGAEAERLTPDQLHAMLDEPSVGAAG